MLAESPCACRIFDVDYDISVHLGRDDEDNDDDHDGGGFGDDDEDCGDGGFNDDHLSKHKRCVETNAHLRQCHCYLRVYIYLGESEMDF